MFGEMQTKTGGCSVRCLSGKCRARATWCADDRTHYNAREAHEHEHEL